MTPSHHLEIPVFRFQDVYSTIVDNLTAQLKDDPVGMANEIVLNGVPKFDQDNIAEFIEWIYFVLDDGQLYQLLPVRYGIKTKDGTWLVSANKCICWEAD